MASPSQRVRGNRWSDEETLLLLQIWKMPSIRQEVKGASRKRSVLTRISEALFERGINRTVEEIHVKIGNLKTSYYAYKRDPDSLQARLALKFYEELTEALSDNNNIDYTCSTEEIDSAAVKIEDIAGHGDPIQSPENGYRNKRYISETGSECSSSSSGPSRRKRKHTATIGTPPTTRSHNGDDVYPQLDDANSEDGIEDTGQGGDISNATPIQRIVFRQPSDKDRSVTLPSKYELVQRAVNSKNESERKKLPQKNNTGKPSTKSIAESEEAESSDELRMLREIFKHEQTLLCLKQEFLLEQQRRQHEHELKLERIRQANRRDIDS